MTKKNLDSAELSDSSEEFALTSKRGCIHVNKGVALNIWRKHFSGTGTSSKDGTPNQGKPNQKFQSGACKECKGNSKEAENENWICLRCGAVACGSPENSDSHILKHFTDPRSDPHVIAINLENWNAWCHKCNEERDVNSTKKLQEAAEFLKRHFARAVPEVPEVIEVNCTADEVDNDVPKIKDINKVKEASDTYSRVKGLTNLGNTCFFNSVMQCLAQTPFLSSLLNESQEGEPFGLPGVPSNDDHSELPPITGTLEPSGPVTKELAGTLTDMQSDNNSSIVNPNNLLSALSQKAPHLAGTGDQEDAHELLRTLMETVRAEELRRYQAKILSAIGLSRKIDPSVVDEDKKYMAKEYSNIAAKLYLRPDHMFQGQLMSILQCQECRSVSCTYETFLDISLPVVSARHPPNLSRKKSIDPDAPSKHQLKKAKQQSKKKKKAARFAVVGPSNKNDVEADAEDNEGKEQDGEKPASERNGDCGPDQENITEEKGLLETESCENKEKLAICEENGESAVQVVTEKMSTLLSSESSDDDGDSGNEVGDSPSDDKESPEEQSEGEEDESSTWSTTLAPRHSDHDTSGEPSVISCLKQFTAIELLTGNNKVGCETCTKRAGKSANGKLVCTNFTKQLLVSAPPGILTLHLKRFEVCGSQFRKVSKSVDFPLILDLASVCSVKCKNLPTVRKDQSKILYSLYGVVEHRGMISGGHYVAYIKSQKVPTLDDVRQRFFLSNDVKKDIEQPSIESDSIEAPQGKWYYASDSYVSEVPEKKVLCSQAYLLFYERIF